jgi:hypothetical protein
LCESALGRTLVDERGEVCRERRDRPDAPLMHLDDLSRDGQPQSRAARQARGSITFPRLRSRRRETSPRNERSNGRANFDLLRRRLLYHTA